MVELCCGGVWCTLGTFVYMHLWPLAIGLLVVMVSTFNNDHTQMWNSSHSLAWAITRGIGWCGYQGNGHNHIMTWSVMNYMILFGLGGNEPGAAWFKLCLVQNWTHISLLCGCYGYSFFVTTLLLSKLQCSIWSREYLEERMQWYFLFEGEDAISQVSIVFFKQPEYHVVASMVA